MHVIFEHEGDRVNDGWQTQEWALGRDQQLNKVETATDRPLSEVHDAIHIARDKQHDSIKVRLSGGDEIVIPGVKVIEVSLEESDAIR